MATSDDITPPEKDIRRKKSSPMSPNEHKRDDDLHRITSFDSAEDLADSSEQIEQHEETVGKGHEEAAGASYPRDRRDHRGYPRYSGRFGRFKGVMIALACIGSLSALMLSVCNLKRLDHLQSDTNHRLATVKQALVPLQTNSLSQEIKQLADKQENFQTRVDEIAKEAQTLQTTFQHPASLNTVWPLLKARYCLELATINERWSRDRATAVALLAQAETLLEPLTEESLMPVKQVIKEEKAILVERIEKEKTTTILSQLESIQHNLFQLPLRRSVVNNGHSSVVNNGHTHSTKLEGNSTSAELPQAKDWQTHLRDNLQALKKLVVVHHGVEVMEPLLPVYQTLLQESIRLELQQAQWALIQKDQVVYRLSLQQVIELMRKAFDINASLTRETIQQVEKLQQLPVDLSNEVIVNRSLQLLEEIIKNKRLLTPTPANQDKVENASDTQLMPANNESDK